MTETRQSTIGELAAAAGTTPRTIRYYTAEGLLPPPDTRGRYALYGEEHLLRLRLIARLKDAFLPLGEIKARLAHLSSVDVAQLLAEYEQAPALAGSASDYVAQVLASSIAPARLSTEARRQPSEAKGGEARMLAESREDYPAAPRAPQPIGFAAPAAFAPSVAPARGMLKHVVSGQRAASTPAPAVEERWQRVTLAPGVELHVREPLAPELGERVARLFEQAHELFDERGGD
jgi:DNA-binding transcriptional MerR regulator